ncbi:MAG: hypothetical protein JSS86_19080, partial [Cyanobacteria bacterium SZAS LIN-2]|nr:hypothetical protein [Cyanobacteria bacterium SZAS LIN-2]
MKGLKNELGQTLVVVALCMTVLLGFAALSVDVGLLFKAKRDMQVAADAAAAAGALDYKYNNSTISAQAAAKVAAASNGVTSANVVINAPPHYGPYVGKTGFVEAIVTDPAPTFFMKMFHINTVNVKARAVAGSGVIDACIWALSRSGTDVSLTGSGSITAQNCAIYDDSNASNAMSLTGSGSISAKAIGIVGGYSVTGSGHISPNPPTTGIGPAADPLNLSPPPIPTGTCSLSDCDPKNTGSGNKTLDPGTYNSISNTGSGTLTLNPGNYIINGDLKNTG